MVMEASTPQPGPAPCRQQHQADLEAAEQHGAVLPSMVEAQPVMGRAHHTPIPSDGVSLGTGLPAALQMCGRARAQQHKPQLRSRA